LSNAEDLVFGRLEDRMHNEALSPETRESARVFRDTINAVHEKRAVMRGRPALCLMEIRRTAAIGGRALELALRYTGPSFWNNPAFRREARKICPELEDI
jgi:hypothetical protein